MEETLKKFDEKFERKESIINGHQIIDYVVYKDKRVNNRENVEQIKQFITQALQDQLKDLEEKVVGEEKTDEYYVSEILKEMNEKPESAISLTKGYNQKRQEIKQIFKEYK